MSNRRQLWRVTAITAAIALASGCGGNVAVPDLFHPGPAGYQRARAIQHDPYPLDDVAEPVVGGRPREYERPVPEPERAVQFVQRPRPAGVAAPGTFAPAPLGPPQPVPYGAAPVTAPPAAVGPPPPQSLPYQYSPPAQPMPTAPTTAPYQLSVPAAPAQPAPYPYGSTVPATPPLQFRPPY